MAQTPKRADQADRDRPSTGRVLMMSLGGVLAVVLVVVGAIGIYLNAIRNSFDDNVQRVDGLVTATPKAKGESLNYLVMGSDSRDPKNDRGRSDALMLVHVSGDRKAVYIISYPRDMWVPIPDHGTAKINAAYAYGGIPLTVRTMEQVNQVPIDHVAVTDFQGFQDITTTLGGVTVNNPNHSSSDGFTFPQGQITIQGPQALAYVRERYDLPRGDFDRAERQRTVVQAIMRKAVSTEVLTNPGQFTNFVGTFSRYLTVDASLTDQELLSTAMSMRGITENDIYLMQAPVSGTGTSADGQSIDIVDQAKLAELQAALKNDTVDQYRAKYPEG
ncbi:cell envelope-related function transcriptional attenuator common domain-containing protein [Raineyella antarctica]|uniref:Cell envelope-related function transcriptional attenuator common domain-containing protein n=1 Tax=Raineyella antarctica TaxID=1577474 RepID=A0A1G6HRD6_9ACTN|nr:LCP family protein [Raineyella antarctica]SDB96718.1 cell envelope-related function transcriptional attenuator common domain-containing protein [Raineyella antarctica]